ncbi:MAG TPA: ABC transporter ATP-binding protein [Terriglobia bacterium]|nr:ABC transporter ATP-binding protein [Terriglobia bacterium]
MFSAFAELRRRAGPFRAVLGFTFASWRRHARWAWASAGAMVLSTVTELLVPVYAGKLIDAVATTETSRAAALDAALSALGMMVVLAGIMLVLRHLGFMAIIRLTLRVMCDVGGGAFARVQRFASDWHANTFAGSVVRKVTRGMWALDMLDDTLLIAMLPSFVVLFGATILLGWRWPVMGIAIFIGAVAFVLLTVLLSIAYVGPAARLSNAWDTRMGGALADAVSCNAVVKAFGAEGREDERLAKVMAKWRRRTHRTWVRGTTNGTLQLVALLLLRLVVVGLALWLWWRGAATPGDVTYVLTTYFVVHGYLRDIGVHIRDMQRSVNDMEELVEIQREEPGIADRPEARAIAITQGRIDFDRVTFHYPGHATALYRDLSVSIAPGEKLALVGLSGSGKSTFVKLIQRLHDIQGGEIRIDGQDIAACRQASLRAQIAIVQQDPVLFHRSLAENIAYAKPQAAMDEIVAAAKLANAHEFIERLPNGYGTLVGERGIKLSGGERQRVALARAFLADAPILILDEATSSLDSESEALIQEATERLIEGRTAIVIAHRLSTVRALKRIMVFEQGRIVEEGDHASLVQCPNGRYRRLFERQVLGLIDQRTAAIVA